MDISPLGEQKEIQQLLLNDAIELVRTELGRTSLSEEEYLEWFAATLGKNTALMSRNGWVHDFSPHNVTLDCRLVDLDNVLKLSEEQAAKENKDRALKCLLELCVCFWCLKRSILKYDDLKYSYPQDPEFTKLKEKVFNIFSEAYEKFRK
jgi:hypothetical protein